MKKICIGVFLCMFCLWKLSAQQTFRISGYVVDKQSETPLQDALVKVANNKYTTTNDKGYFSLDKLTTGTYQLQVILLGHKDYFIEITLRSNQTIYIALEEELSTLSEVVLHSKTHQREAKETAIVSEEINETFLEENRENSLMQTLNKIAGVSSITIGSGQSKPVIRGLGFNRVAVIQKGIKHEAQQWGSDHGLEIDQYGIDEIQIIKGPASLMYGSDAIAGVVNIRQDKIPEKNTFSGEINLLAETNNDLFGTSVGMQSRKNKWYYNGRLTYRDYADYKVPTDSIRYDNNVFELHDNNLRNTAGKEANASFGFGYISNKFKTETYISNVHAKTGFFANAHGFEVRLSDIDYDASNRDIDLPYHKLNHIKLINNSSFIFDKHILKFGLGFQNNLREEYSEPTPHGFMPKPSSTKERKFNKSTYILNVKDEFVLNHHDIVIGANTEYQNNRIGGWGFLIPEYKRFTSGIFVYDKYMVKENLFLQAGLRYDFGVVDTVSYFDWFQSEVNNENGTTSSLFIQRAKDQTSYFYNTSASLGLSYIRDKTSYKLNVGKSFRVPLANELASNGVNYHMFRYEKGNPDLDAESSYQIDAQVTYEANSINVSVTPFVNFFDNFIYLNPTSNYYETLQIYDYTQTQVFRFGGEINVNIQPWEALQVNASIEYVYGRQTSGVKKGFALPFSPPLSSFLSVTYALKDMAWFLKPQFKADFRLTAKQEDIVPPEEYTSGYNVLGVSFISEFEMFNSKNRSQLRIKVNNVFDTKYFDHTSFYRLIDVPEAGRNLSVSLTIPF
ncbi:MAG: TonB-dependent receptor [Flavobacteriaceae bacterium]|nr:TonB-dependent receptor [Flavobacteriaceae bacterium]